MADKRISQLIERVDIANNDVLPIVASGAITTNKVTISSIQTYMQENLDVGVTSVGITIGTSGTDVNVSGSPVTTSGNITINIPDASATARGVVNTGLQTFEGLKTFADGLSLPSLGGGNQITRIVNIGTLHQGTAGLNQIGFNSGNNIYFGKGLSNGGVISWNNSAVRFYTLQDADGTLAFTSQLDGYVTLDTAQTITGSKTFNSRIIGQGETLTGSGSPDTLEVFHTSGSGIAVDISKAGDGEGLRVAKTSGSGNAVTISGGLLSAEAASFSGNIAANGGLTLAAAGTADPTILRNTSGTTSSTTGSNVIGFNGTNNIFVTTESRGGFILGFNNSVSNREYTLPDASGTIALTSNLGAYLPLTGGTLTGGLGGTSASFSGDVQTGTRLIASNSGAEIRITPNLSGTTNRIESFGSLPFSLTSIGAITLAAGGTTPQVTLSTGGAVTLTGVLNGTSASFSGVVGIGTPTPSKSLEIISNVSQDGIKISGSSNPRLTIIDTTNNVQFDALTTDTEAVLRTDTNHPLVLSTNGTPRLTIASTGAATFSSSVTANSLLVERSASRNMLGISSISLPTSGAEEGVAVVKTNSNLWQMSLVGYAADSKGMRIYNTGGAGNTSLEVATGAGTAFIVNGSGLVGIGTTSPNRLLTLYKSSTPILQFVDDATGTGPSNGFLIYNGGVNAYLENTSNGFMSFQTAGSERMRITSGGYLKASNNGSYTYLNNAFFSVDQSIADWTQVNVNKVASGTPLGIFVGYSAQSPNNTSSLFFLGQDSTTDRFAVRSNGGIANYQANDVNLSDERVKKDIEPLESYWDKFKAIEIVKFKYKDQTHDDFNIGVIAQQVEAVAPEFVDVDGWDTKPELDEEGNEIVSEEEPLKSIYTADLHHATIKVLQEAMAKIEKLEAEIDSLKNQMQ